MFPYSSILTLNVHFFHTFSISDVNVSLQNLQQRVNLLERSLAPYTLPPANLSMPFGQSLPAQTFHNKTPTNTNNGKHFFVNKWFYFYHENKAKSFSSINFSKKPFNIFDPKVVLIKLNEIIRNILWFRCKLKANKNTNSFTLDNETFPKGKFWFIYFLQCCKLVCFV